MTKSKWYVINVHATYEKKVAQQIMEQAQKKGLGDLFEEILVPSEEVVEIRRGNKKFNVEKNFFPGYVLIRMVLTDDTWHLVRQTPRFTSFLGSGGKPMPISLAEVNRIMSQVQESIEKPKLNVLYEIGEQVRVCDGAFATFTGSVEEVDSEKGRLKVSVMIFGRPTPIELEFTQVEKQ